MFSYIISRTKSGLADDGIYVEKEDIISEQDKAPVIIILNLDGLV